MQLDVDRARVRAAILRHSIKFSESYAKDGRLLDWCIDLRELLYRPSHLKLVAKLLWDRIRHLHPHFIGGMTLSAEQLTCGLLSEALADGRELAGFSVRRMAKTYGRRRRIEGVQPGAGSRVVVVDDLLDRGQTVADVLSALQPFKATVVGVAAVVDFCNPSFSTKASDSIPRNSLFNLGDLGLRGAPATSARPLFRFGPLNAGDYTAPHSTPLIDKTGIVAASDTGYVIAIDLSGHEVWRLRTGNHVRGVRSILLNFEDSIFFCGYDGFAHRVARATGEILWTTPLGDFVGASPTIDVADGVAFVAVNYRTRRSDVLAIDLASGHVIWRRTGIAESYARPGICDPDLVIFAGNDGIVQGLSRSDGEIRWKTRLPAQVKGWIVADGASCFLGCFDGCLYALDGRSGQPLWHKKLAEWLLVHPVAIRGHVIVSSASHLCSLSQADGTINWVAPCGGRVTGVGVDPTGDMCVGAGEHGDIFCFDSASGRRRWEYRIKGQFRVTPAVSADLCAVPGFDGSLYVFALPGTASSES
ncbi:outer membrane protein assembly factor BamB family protein [Paraburkholderia strydomiana]|uniref:PQQ-binding-like beta-propeller repeat protein n=1 Tax=Paraburkholderia strydomiana TaxID=1245417 RepID=A0ABW9BXN9_9BURK